MDAAASREGAKELGGQLLCSHANGPTAALSQSWLAPIERGTDDGGRLGRCRTMAIRASEVGADDEMETRHETSGQIDPTQKAQQANYLSRSRE